MLTKPSDQFEDAASTGWFMQGKCPFLLLRLCCAVALVMMGGCVSTPDSSDHTGGLHVEIVPSSLVHLLNIHVRQEGSELVISGNVARHNAAFSGMGHVDLAVVSPDGVVMILCHTAYSPEPLAKTPGARQHRPSRFEERLVCIPPPGSTIRVAYHGNPDSKPSPLDHDHNYAVPKHHDYGS